MTAGHNIDQLMDFPSIYSFKIIGDNTPRFRYAAAEVFKERCDAELTEKVSSNEKYLSITATTEVADKDELIRLYGLIKDLPGVKYWL